MTRMRRTLTTLAVAAAAAFALAPSASAAEATCPGTFEVLHNDRIGSMQLPKGPYVVTLLDSTEIGCSEASHLFSQFLEDFDGRLPRPWVGVASSRTFTQGRGSSIGFRVTPDTNPNPPTPPHPPSKRVCPGYFSVLHNDYIGRLRIPKGKYHLILLSLTNSYSCSQASSDFARFLQDYTGVLPRPWYLDTATASFQNGSSHVGFRIKPYVTTGGRSRGRHPSAGQSRCPATFRVENNDRIGALRLARGNYNVWVSGLSCPRSSQLFAQFLDLPLGDLPRPWVLNARTATFSRGTGGSVNFRVKRVLR